MDYHILEKIYANDVYLNYLRYNPRWYSILDEDSNRYADFEKEIKANLKLTTADKIESFRKQIEFISGMIKYLSS